MKFESINSNNKKEKINLKEKFSKIFRRHILIGAMSIASIVAFESCTGHNDYSEFKTFNEAFKKARENDEKIFKWNGRKYTTELVDKETSDLYFESKAFLEEYYSSDYFKSKQPIDSFQLSMNLSRKFKDNERYKYLFNKINEENGFLTEKEFDEYVQLLKEEEEKTGYSSEAFKHDADSVQSVRSKQRIQNLKEPLYISITNQKGNMRSDGKYIAHTNGDKSLFIYRNKNSNNITTSVHELTHKSTDANTMIDDKQSVDMRNNAFNSIKDNEDFARKYGQEGFDYLSDPTEIDARQNSTRFYLFKNFKGYKPDTVFNGEHYDFLLKNRDGLPYDIKQLMDLFPDKEIFISNMNTY